MPEQIGELSLNVLARVDNLEAQINRAVSRVEKRGINLPVNSSLPLNRIGRDINDIDKSLAAANARVIAFGASVSVITAVSTAVKKMVTDFIEVEKSLVDINSIFDLTKNRLGQFSDSLFDIARNTGSAFKEASDAAKEFSRQGLSVDETLRRTRDALILYRTTGLDAAKAVSGLTAAVNTFAKEGLTTTDILNRLAAVDTSFAVSSKDLIEGISKAGQSATEAGISFNQYISLVTAIKERTAIAGSDIGNALKTIFTRTQRSDTLDQLESLGVAVRDTAGRTLPLIQILESLAKTQDSLTDTQKAYIDEIVAGGFQINKLKAGLSDLSSQNSRYAKSLQVASRAGNEAVDRNEELNKSFAALKNSAGQTLTQISASLGEGLFAPALRNLLDFVNSAKPTAKKGLEAIAGAFGASDAEATGEKIGDGIIKGLGSFIGGPGVILVTAVVGKLLARLAGDAVYSIKQILNTSAAVNKTGEAEQRVLDLQKQRLAISDLIIGKTKDQLIQENLVLSTIQKEIQATRELAAVRKTANQAQARITQNAGGVVNKKYAPTAPGVLGGSIAPASLSTNLPAITNLARIASISAPTNVSSIPGFLRNALGINQTNNPFGNLQIPASAANRNIIRDKIARIDSARQAANVSVGSSEIEQIIAANNLRDQRRGNINFAPQRKQISFQELFPTYAASPQEVQNFIARRDANNRFFGGVRDATQRGFNFANPNGIGARVSNSAFPIGFGASVLGNTVGNVVGGSTGRKISGIGDSIAAGATVAALVPGPVGLAAGGVTAALLSLKAVVESSKKTLEEYNATLDSNKNKRLDESSAANNFLSARNALEDGIKNGFDPKQLKSLQRNFNSARAQLPTELLGITSLSRRDAENAVDTFNTRNQNRNAIDASRKQLAELTQKSNVDFGARQDITSVLSKIIRLRDISPDTLRDVQDRARSAQIAGGNTQFQVGNAKSLLQTLGFSSEDANRVASSLGDNALSSIRKLANEIEKLSEGAEKTSQKIEASAISFRRFSENLNVLIRKSSSDFAINQNARANKFNSNSDVFSALNNANADFLNPIANISNRTSSDRLKSLFNRQNDRQALQKTAREQLLGLSRFDFGANEAQKLNFRNTITGTLGNPDSIRGLSILENTLSNLNPASFSSEQRDAFDKLRNVLEDIRTQDKISADNLQSQLETLRKIEYLQSLNVSLSKVNSNFRGTGALNAPQNFAVTSFGRRTSLQDILERNNPRFRANEDFALQFANGDREAILANRENRRLRRSDSIGRGIIQGFESGAIPKEEDAFLLNALGDRRGALQARALNSVNRLQLGESFLNRRNADINEQGSNIVNTLLEELQKTGFAQGGEFTLGNRQSGLGKQIRDAARKGNFQEVNNRLNQLSGLDANPAGQAAINRARQDLLGLTLQQKLAPIASNNNAAIVAGSPAGPLTNATFIRGIEDMIRAIRDQETVTEERQNALNSPNSLNELINVIKEIGLTPKEAVQAEADQTKQIVQNDSSLSAKIDVALTNVNSDGFVTKQEQANFEAELKAFVAEYFKTGGKVPPKAAQPK